MFHTKAFWYQCLLLLVLCSNTIFARPLISLILCIRNEQNDINGFLKDYIKQSMINDSEVLIINTVSSQSIQEIIAAYQKHYPQIRQLRVEYDAGIMTLYNLAMCYIQGTYAMIAHIDDRYCSHALQSLTEQLENSKADIVYADYYISHTSVASFDDSSGATLVTMPEYTPSALANGVPGVVVAWDVLLYRKAGYFRKDCKELGEWEYFNRAALRGATLKKCPDVLAVHYQSLDVGERIAQKQQETENITKEYRNFWNDCEPQLPEKPMVIVIPSYNNFACYKKNLDSIFNQKYANYRIIYIDDASCDGTADMVEWYVKDCGQEKRFTLIRNAERLGAAANKYKGAQLCRDDEIYIDLDGDDWLAHDNVLKYLNRVYANPDVWVTYGQFMYHPIGTPGWASQLPQSVIDSNQVRRNDWVTTALRTFYAGLFKRIDPEYLKIEGKFVSMASDLAFMFCIMEMAGHKSIFIPEVLYVYNIGTTHNDGTINRQMQFDVGHQLRLKKPYQRVDSYITTKKKLYITRGFWGDLFDVSSPVFNRDNCLQSTVALKQRLEGLGYEVEQPVWGNLLDGSSHSDAFEHENAPVICFEVPYSKDIVHLLKHPKEKRVLFLWEPPTVLPHCYDPKMHELFERVYTWNDDLVDNKKYFKFYYPVWRPMCEDIVDFDQKSFATMVACNKYSNHPNELYTMRRAVIDFFEKNYPDDFDLFGRGWNAGDYTTYKGTIAHKNIHWIQLNIQILI